MMAEKKERVELLLEEIRDDVKAVAEGHGVIRSEMKQMEERLNEKFEVNNSAIKWVAKELGGRIDSVEKKLSGRIDSVEEKLSGGIDSVETKLSGRIDEVKQKVDKIDKTLNEHVRLPAHA